MAERARVFHLISNFLGVFVKKICFGSWAERVNEFSKSANLSSSKVHTSTLSTLASKPPHPDDREQSQGSLFNWFASTGWPPGLCLYSLSRNTLHSSPPSKACLSWDLKMAFMFGHCIKLGALLSLASTSFPVGWWGEEQSFLLVLSGKGSLLYSLTLLLSLVPTPQALRQETSTRNSC